MWQCPENMRDVFLIKKEIRPGQLRRAVGIGNSIIRIF